MDSVSLSYWTGENVHVGDWYESDSGGYFQILAIKGDMFTISMLHGSGPNDSVDTSVHRRAAKLLRRGVVGEPWETER